MEYLVIAHPNPAVPPTPQAMDKLVPQALQWLQNEQSAGRLSYIAGFASGQGGIAIVAVDTPEELNAQLADFPLSVFQTYDVQPLANIEATLSTLQKTYQKVGQWM